jgi:MYXO-CTERM domain-containing protein
MMKRLGILLALSLVFVAAGEVEAQAHFKLTQPADALKTDETGDPMGGSQKSSPCGSGTATKVATQVKAGSKLHVKLTETIPHGGHYRIALSPNKADFVDPKAVVTGGNCVSAPISQPSGVILADGLFVHADEDFGSGKVWETDVTIPDKTCPNCILQIIEFMTPHSPGCFYYHCANIQVLDANATIEGDGVVPITDPSTSSSSSGETSSSSGETSSSGTSGASSTSGGQKAPESSSSGCNVTTSSTAPSYITMGIAGVVVLASLRRRRRLHDRRAR